MTCRPAAAWLALAIACVAGWLLPAAAWAQSNLPPGFEMRTTVGGFTKPTGMAFAPDGRIFVVEKPGRLVVARADGTLPPTTVLDFNEKVNDIKDRGLLGVAVDKDFATNGFVYMVYVYELNPLNPDQIGEMVSRLVRVKVNPDNTIANPSNPETVLLGTYSSGPCPFPASNTVDCIPADWTWHTIGSVRVDPVDGTLWLGSGDTSEVTTKPKTFRTYDENSFAGKIIHVDRDGRGLPGHPFCKAETDYTKVCTKLYAKGFRNPFRFTLRPGKGPIVGDVGNGRMEEIDLVKPGRSYGWPCYEATRQSVDYQTDPICVDVYEKVAAGAPDAPEPPTESWLHTDGYGGSSTGGPLYTGSTYPADYRGDILYGDYAQGWVKRLEIDANDKVTAVRPFFDGIDGAMVDLQQDPQGNLAYLDIGYFSPAYGKIRHIAYTGDKSPTVTAEATPTTGSAPLTVQLKAVASDPEGQPLTYDWDFGDGSPHASTAAVSHTYSRVGPVTAKVTVTDPAGNRTSDDVAISVGRRPVPAIKAPLPTLKYRNGVAVALSGSATDAEDGALTGTSLAWQVKLHHKLHTHELMTATGATASFITARDHDADSYYEIILTATDSDGLTATKAVTIKPATRKITLNSSPPGAPVTYDGIVTGDSPLSRQATIGYRPSVTAAESFVANGRTYRFHSWSDGGGRSHTITVPEVDAVRVANYRAEGLDTFVFRPSGDVSLDSRTPAAPSGSAAFLAADASPARLSLVRFGVTGLDKRRVVGVRLGLYATTNALTGAGTITPATGLWSEAATVWNTRPALGLLPVGSYGAMRSSEWFELPLGTSAVAGDGDVSLALTSTSDAGAVWGSRESWAKPRLVVEAEPPTQTYTAVADAYTSAADPTLSFGTEPSLIVDGDPERRAYLRFNVTGLAGKRVVGAKLRMYNVNRSPVGGQVQRVPSNTWTEAMTHANRAAVETPVLGSFGAVVEGAWYEAPLTAGLPTADGPFSVALSSANADGAGWDSRETARDPELILQVEPL